MDEKITDIRFNPIKFHPKKKTITISGNKGRKKKEGKKTSSANRSVHGLPAKISFQSTSPSIHRPSLVDATR